MQTWLNLQDKIIIVTGGASGIGLAIVGIISTRRECTDGRYSRWRWSI